MSELQDTVALKEHMSGSPPPVSNAGPATTPATEFSKVSFCGILVHRRRMERWTTASMELEKVATFSTVMGGPRPPLLLWWRVRGCQHWECSLVPRLCRPLRASALSCADGSLTHRSDDSQGWDAPRLSCMVLAGGCALVALDIASAQASGPAVGEHPCGARSSVCTEYRARARYVWCSALLSVWTMCV